MPRKIRVTTTSFDILGARTVEQNRDQALAFVEVVGGEGADLVCLPETFLETGLPVDQLLYAESLPGSPFAALARLADKHRLWVVAGYSVPTDDGAIENSGSSSTAMASWRRATARSTPPSPR